MDSKKMFAHEDMLGMPPKHRVPVVDTTKYDPSINTQWFEDSDYLTVALQGVPYATYKTNSSNLMSELLMNGYTDKDNVVWTPFFAFWKDQEGRAFLAPRDEQVDLALLGIHATLKTAGDVMKFDKYLNRLLSALPKKLTDGPRSAWGTEVGWSEEFQTAVYGIDATPGTDLTNMDRRLSVRFVDLSTLTKEQKALVDGSMVFSDRACRALNLTNNPKQGMAWRGTIATPRGLGKGHILYKDGMKVDIVIYGPKKILTTDRFFFGSMGPLHAGDPHTDAQSFINFGFHRNGLAISLAKQYMKEVVAASKNEDKLRRLFLRHTKDIEHADMDPQEWILRKALANGVSFLRFPGLYRRVINFLMKEVQHCYKRARIPMQGETYSKAMSAYVLGDIMAIDEEGGVHPDLAINKGGIIFPDLPPGTKVVCYRQPNENSNAWVPLTVVSHSGYERFKGQGICMLGQGADKVMERLGGGDMDDSFVIVHDPVWVNAFHTLRPYPETPKISDEDNDADMSNDIMELDAFTDECLEDMQEMDMAAYCNKHVQIQIDMSKRSRANIGPVVNFGMDDMLKSDPDHLTSMVEDLESNPEAAEWLLDREQWQAAQLMSNLERVIDGNVKDATLLVPLGDVAGKIKDYHLAQKVYPKCIAGNALEVKAGKVPASQLRTRIPKRLALKGDYVVAKSLTCKALEQIENLAHRLENVFIEREWSLVAPADNAFRPRGVPPSSLPYGYEKEVKKIVKGLWKRDDEFSPWEPQDEDQETPLMDLWFQEWASQFSLEEVSEGAYKSICDIIEARIADCDDYMRERMAVELYYQTFKDYQPGGPKTNSDGSLKHYPDALLWSPVFGSHFINALKKEELAGCYRMASLSPKYAKALSDKAVAVKVAKNNVYVRDENGKFSVWVGYVYGCPSNIYRMDDGLIQVKEADDICRPEDTSLIPAQRPLVRIFRKRGEPELVIPKEEEATGFFGKLMAKALNILQ